MKYPCSPACPRRGTDCLFKVQTDFVLILLFMVILGGSAALPEELFLETPMTVDISPGEQNEHTLYVEAHRFLHVEIRSPNVQLFDTLTTTDSSSLIFARFENTNGFSIKAVAEQSDSLHLKLSADQQTEKGRYVIVLQERREATATDKSMITAKIQYDEAFVLEQKGDSESLQKAQQKYTESLKIWQKINDDNMITKTLQRLGETCFTASDFQGMQSYYYRALRQSREHGDQKGEALARYKIGVAMMNKNESFEALDIFEQALELSQQSSLPGLEADILTSIGQVYTEFDDYEQGIEYVQQSLEIRKTLGKEEEIASALLVLGDAYVNLGESQKALDYYHEALNLYRKNRDRQGEAIVLGSIGWVYDQFSEYDTALDYYEQSLTISQDIDYLFGKAWIVKLLGDVHRKMGNYKVAINNYNISLELCQQMGVRVGESANYSNLAMVYVEMDSLDMALDYLNKARLINLQINHREGEGSILHKIGSVYARKGDTDKAVDFYEQALAVAQTLQDPRLFQRTYFALGQQERRAGNLERAKDYIEKSLQLADSLRSSVLSQKMRATYFASIHSLYDELLLLLMQQHRNNPDADYAHQAFQISEKSRCQSLLEMLNEGQVDLRAGIDPELLERERLVRQKLNAREQQRQRLLTESPDSDTSDALADEIRALLNEYENIETRIRQAQPRLAAIEKAEALPFDQIQNEVLDDSTLLIEYALTEEKSFAWAITSDHIACVELPVADDIEATARIVYDNLTARNAFVDGESTAQRFDRIRMSDENVSSALLELSDKILSPLADHLDKPRIVFVCDEILQYMPMAALPMPGTTQQGEKSNDRLVNHFEILSAPSASALPLIREEKNRGRQPDKLLAIFADPVFSSSDPRLSSSLLATNESTSQTRSDALDQALQETGMGTRSDLSRLPFSRLEATDILTLAGTDACQCYMDFDATYSTAVAPDLSRFNIVHFATHGMMNTINPELSGLVLSLYDQGGHSQNGYLRLHDIYQLDLNADLVVLSACQTALGKEIRGEGLIGLTRGFMYAGAPRVLASLWKVDDEATAALMKQFYSNKLEKDMPAAKALQQAQLTIKNEKRWVSPYYWAAFVLQGDWQE